MTIGKFPLAGSAIDCTMNMYRQGITIPNALKECNNTISDQDIKNNENTGTTIESLGGKRPNSSFDCTDLSHVNNPAASGSGHGRSEYPGNVDNIKLSWDKAKELAIKTAIKMAINAALANEFVNTGALLYPSSIARDEIKYPQGYATPEEYAQFSTQALKAALNIVEREIDSTRGIPGWYEAYVEDKREIESELIKRGESPNQYGDYPLSDTGTTATAMTDPNSDNVISCSDLFEFLDSCSQTNWTSDACSQLKTGCYGYDPTVALMDPNGQDPSCKLDVTKDSVQQIYLLKCSMLSRPAPGEEPCKKTNMNIEINHYVIKNPSGNTCSDPRALCSDNQGISITKYPRTEHKSITCIDGLGRTVHCPINTTNGFGPSPPPGPIPAGPFMPGPIIRG